MVHIDIRQPPLIFLNDISSIQEETLSKGGTACVVAYTEHFTDFLRPCIKGKMTTITIDETLGTFI